MSMRRTGIVCAVSLSVLIVTLIMPAPLSKAWASGIKAQTKQRAEGDIHSPPQIGTGQILSGQEIPGSSNNPGPRARAQDKSIIANIGGRLVSAQNPSAACGTGLIINATFDSSITGNANSAAIQAMINQAIGIFQSLFADAITVSILFRYSTTAPNGSPLGSGTLAQST